MMYHNKYFINYRKCHSAVTWLMLLIIFLLIFLNIAFNYKYYKYDETLGYIKKLDDYYLSTYVEDLSIYKYTLLIDGKEKNITIYSISDGYYIIDGKKYYEIILSTELDKEVLIENNIINIVFRKEQTTLFEEFKKGMKKWLN